jgi:hypothetical protein
MARKYSPPPNVPLLQGNMIDNRWAEFFAQFEKKAATQTDAVNAAGDPPTQAEFNALVTVVNDLIDKFQAAGLME